MICFGIDDNNIRKMAEGDPLYVPAETLNMPMDFQMTIGKKSASIPGRSCFITDLSDITLERLRGGGVIHILANNVWSVPNTYIFYGKDEPDLRRMTNRVVEQLTGKTFKEMTGEDIEDFYPIPKGMETYVERKSDGSIEAGVRPAHEKVYEADKAYISIGGRNITIFL